MCGINFESQYKMKKKIKRFIVFVGIASIVAPAAIFINREIEREKRLRIYASEIIVHKNLGIGEFQAGAILSQDEVMVCALSAYSDPSDLKDLSENQFRSIPKSRLPSVDGSWYLITFGKNEVKRISLVSLDEMAGLADNSAPCAATGDNIALSRTKGIWKISFQRNTIPEEK
tara:strand:+ start:169 stop:687 length:519 start_codon:yes stop_codon:yes gene_type:complete